MQLIDLTGLTTFGNMTYGDGLAGIMNPDTAHVGYSQSTGGYAGVTLATASKIVSADIISADNGFDASSNTTSITIKLYGKTGSAPSSATDGTVLGTLTFTDVNTNTTKTITSSNQDTAYNHVWVSVTTGVWCILAAFKPYTIDAVSEYFPSTPTDDHGSRYTVTRFINTAIALCQQETEAPEYRIGVYAPAAAVATVSYQGAFVHNMVNDYMGVIGGVSVVPHYRIGDSWAECKAASKQCMSKGIMGGNILNHDDHYINLKTDVKMTLTSGKYYMFGIDLNAQTPYPQVGDGQASLLVEGGNGLNQFTVTIDKNETLIEGI